MLDLAILGYLKEGPCHGYELRRRLGSLGLWSVSFGSLYPALRRLERRGEITPVGANTRKKAYAITEVGEAHFDELMAEPLADDDRAFAVRVAFFRFLAPERRLELLEQRRAALARRAATTRASVRRALSKTRERIDRYTLALMEQGANRAEADIAWIDELIETERAALRRLRGRTEGRT
jgi:DNA-binding PadR family transcriptional regulator